MKQVNDLGITVWLRFAHEVRLSWVSPLGFHLVSTSDLLAHFILLFAQQMNGAWYSWGMQPES
jgi:hypothetical protein